MEQRIRWNRYDICEAWYLYARQYHGGQFTPLYAVLGRIHNLGFTLSQALRDSDDPNIALSTGNARAIFNQLVQQGE